MADFPSSPIDWVQGWTEIQQQAWKTWSGLAQDAVKRTAGMGHMPRDPFSPEAAMRMWQEGLSQWWNLFSPPPVESPHQAFVRNTFSAGENFLKMGGEVFKVFQELHGKQQMGEEWTTTLNRIMEQAKDVLTQSTRMWGGDSARQMMSLWGLPMESWKNLSAQIPTELPDLSRIFGQMGGMPPMMGMGSFMGAGSANEQMDRILSAPALGYTREMQERQQELMKYGLEYQQALADFSNIIGQVGVRALTLLHQRLLELGASEKPLNSLKELYDLWVDCGEQAHAEVATQTSYAESNARLVNAMVKVRNQSQKMFDHAMASMNLPNRQELNTAHRSITEMRRRVRELESQLREVKRKGSNDEKVDALRDDLERGNLAGLREEVDALKEEVALLKKVAAASDDKPAPAAAAKKVTKSKSKAKDDS